MAPETHRALLTTSNTNPPSNEKDLAATAEPTAVLPQKCRSHFQSCGGLSSRELSQAGFQLIAVKQKSSDL